MLIHVFFSFAVTFCQFCFCQIVVAGPTNFKISMLWNPPSWILYHSAVVCCKSGGRSKVAGRVGLQIFGEPPAREASREFCNGLLEPSAPLPVQVNTCKPAALPLKNAVRDHNVHILSAWDNSYICAPSLSLHLSLSFFLSGLCHTTHVSCMYLYQYCY